MERTESKSETLNRLFKENGLLKEDWFEHSQYRILTRSGIEKVQYKNNITIRFEAVTMTPGFCVVKAQAIKPTTDGQFIEVQTFGSAGFNADGNFPKNKGNQYLYFPEMAEKRALSRAVLKACNFYELGVFGEDEAEDFKPQKAVPRQEQSKKQSPEIDNAVANYVDQAKGDEPFIHQKTDFLLVVQNSMITKEEKDKLVANLNAGKYTCHTIEEATAKVQATIKKREASKPVAA